MPPEEKKYLKLWLSIFIEITKRLKLVHEARGAFSFKLKEFSKLLFFEPGIFSARLKCYSYTFPSAIAL